MQVSEENKREKEFRAALEQRVEEVRRMAKKDLQTLETEIEECRALHTRQHREIASLREERDTSLQRACAAKVEADALDVRLNALTVEYDGLAEELEAARQRAREAEAVAARVQREFQDYRCQVGDKETDTLQHVTAQLVEAKTTHLTEFSQLKRTHAEEVAGLKAQWEETIAGRLREVEERHAQDMTAVQKQLADRVSELAMCRDALEDQKQERSTLEVRFAAQEAQSLQQQKEIKRLQQLLHSGGGGTGRYYAGQMSPGRDRDQDGHHDRSVQDGMGTLDFLPSPMFSEDLGAASFSYPASPVNTSHARPTQYAYGGHGGAGLQPQQMQTGGAGGFRSDEFAPGDLTRHVTNRHVPESEAFHAWGESKSGAYGSVLEDLRDSGESLRGPGGEDEKVYQLQDENERLKRIVKEVSPL